MKRICFIVNGYPTKEDPIYTFIKPVVSEMTDRGIKCTIIAAQSITNSIVTRKKLRPTKWCDLTDKNNEIQILQPIYFSFSNFKINGTKLSMVNRDKAILSAFKKIKEKPDVLYSHFWNCAIPASEISRKYHIPIINVSGESEIALYDSYQKNYVNSLLKEVKGTIFVSTKNKKESEKLELIDKKSKTVVLPNGYDEKYFRQINKKKAREILDIKENEMIAIFVGDSSNRKGSTRVVEAAKKISNLKLIMIGIDEIYDENNQILFAGRVPHNQLATYLCAADMFVLPTLAEGCCNAIIEALACGLPIISSNLDFNDDILDDLCSIRINPESIDEIAQAMFILANDKTTRDNLSKGSLKKSETLKIQARVEKIIDFINSVIN